MRLRKLTREEVEVVLSIEDEDVGPEGSFSSGDADADDRFVREIHERLDRGDTWAWCVVKVEARWNGFVGTAYLGGCSYEDEADFRQEGGYYGQMAEEALDDLNGTLSSTFRRLSELAVQEAPGA